MGPGALGLGIRSATSPASLAPRPLKALKILSNARPTMTTCTPALEASSPKSSQSRREAPWIGTTPVVTSIEGRRRSTHCVASDKSSHQRLRCRGPPTRERRAKRKAVIRKARKEEPVNARLAFSAGRPVRMVMRMKVFLRPQRRCQHRTAPYSHLYCHCATRRSAVQGRDMGGGWVWYTASTALHCTRTCTRACTRACARRALAWSGRLTPSGSTQTSQS
jgi:hypothetical protein